LRSQGLTDPVPRTAAFRRREASIPPQIPANVRARDGLVGLPVANEVTLACYDRERVSSPPQTLDQLLALAASGATVGMALDPIGLFWTVGLWCHRRPGALAPWQCAVHRHQPAEVP
jgi:hypothetical protein